MRIIDNFIGCVSCVVEIEDAGGEFSTGATCLGFILFLRIIDNFTGCVSCVVEIEDAGGEFSTGAIGFLLLCLTILSFLGVPVVFGFCSVSVS